MQVPDIEVTDEYDVLHRVWKVSDPATINMVLGVLENKKLIIADGHHRYETALKYSKENAPQASTYSERSTSSLPQPAYPEAAVMMTLVNMDGEGIVILPTHRVVHSLEGFSVDAFLNAAEPFFAVQTLDGPYEADRLLPTLSASGPRTLLAVSRGRAQLLTPRVPAVESALAEAGVSERKRQLDVVQLHQLVLEQLLAISPEAIREQKNLRYVRDAADAIGQAQRGEANIAFLTHPVTLDQLREVTFAGEVMPQKSTDFFPKLLSGLTVYALNETGR